MERLRGLCRSSARATADTNLTEPEPAVLSSADDADAGLGAEDGDGGCSEASVLQEVLTFFARDSDDLKVLSLLVDDETSQLDAVPRHCLAAPKVAAWSPDGAALATVDTSRGVVVVDLPGGEEHVLSQSSPTVQQLQWSPLATCLVTQSPPRGEVKGEEAEANVQVWRRDDEGNLTCEMSFHNPKFERSHFVFQWTADERFCCHHLADGALQLHSGCDFSRPPVRTFSLRRAAVAFDFARSSCFLGARLSVFIADTRDSLQRVVDPAEVIIFDLPTNSQTDPISIKFGQEAELKWSPTGTALLVHCQTDIDDSGQSYYGGSKLVLAASDGKWSLDLTDAKGGDVSGMAVQAVSWSPTRDEFVLVQGFQPARATHWVWDANARTCIMTTVLQEKAHRNTIRWNPFGSIVCVAGFGNLAGEVDFFGRSTKGLARVASCVAPCTVSSEWAPDGRHLLMAVLAPRMRVDNGLSVWSGLTGTKVGELPFEELLEVQWRPEETGAHRFTDISEREIDHILSGAKTRLASVDRGKKQAYRPPSARDAGANRVAMMMRGELGADGAAPSGAPARPSGLAPLRETPPRLSERAEALGAASSPFGAARPAEKPARPSHRPDGSHGSKQPCPTTGWEYMDPKGKKQGPFTLEQMQAWHLKGLFKQTLPMRCDPSDRFVPLGELFPHPMVPFLRAPRRPS